MPNVYMVKWPVDCVSIVTAEDEEELYETINKYASNRRIEDETNRPQSSYEYQEFAEENLILTFSPNPRPFKEE